MLGLAVTVATEVVTGQQQQQRSKIMINLFGALLRPVQMTGAAYVLSPVFLFAAMDHLFGVVMDRAPATWTACRRY